MERARQRDAGRYMDYGFTRPSVISKGSVAKPAMTGGGATGSGTTSADQEPASEEKPEPAVAPMEPETDAVEADVVLNLPDYRLEL